MAIRATIAIAMTFVVFAAGSVPAVETDIAAKPPLPGDLPAAYDVRLGGDHSQTRLVFDLTRKIDLRVFTLADPYRVVIDVPQVTFKLPPKAGETGRGLVKAFRFGLIMQGGSRIVVDAAKPVRVERAFVLDAAQDQPARLVVDLAATDHESFMRNLLMENKAREPATSYHGTAREASPRASADPRPIIVLDPGHGGLDTGTKTASGDAEKVIVLEFAVMLRDRLEKSGKYRVVMTRTDDVFVPLGERVRFARERQAALFISIHADWLPRREGNVQGASIYTLSEKASDAEAAHLAEAENKADVIAGIDLATEPDGVADILIDLAQRETKTFSAQFARHLVKELKDSVRLHKYPMKSAGFRVLKAPDVPSVLIELGYVSNRDDLKLLKSDGWRARMAESIARAVDVFFMTRLADAPAARERP